MDWISSGKRTPGFKKLLILTVLICLVVFAVGTYWFDKRETDKFRKFVQQKKEERLKKLEAEKKKRDAIIEEAAAETKPETAGVVIWKDDYPGRGEEYEDTQEKTMVFLDSFLYGPYDSFTRGYNSLMDLIYNASSYAKMEELPKTSAQPPGPMLNQQGPPKTMKPPSGGGNGQDGPPALGGPNPPAGGPQGQGGPNPPEGGPPGQGGPNPPEGGPPGQGGPSPPAGGPPGQGAPSPPAGGPPGQGAPTPPAGGPPGEGAPKLPSGKDGKSIPPPYALSKETLNTIEGYYKDTLTKLGDLEMVSPETQDLKIKLSEVLEIQMKLVEDLKASPEDWELIQNARKVCIRVNKKMLKIHRRMLNLCKKYPDSFNENWISFLNERIGEWEKVVKKDKEPVKLVKMSPPGGSAPPKNPPGKEPQMGGKPEGKTTSQSKPGK